MAQVNPKEEHSITLKEFKEFVTQITIVDGKVDRIDSHFKEHNKTLGEFTKTLHEIHQFIRGNELNGNKGLSHKFDEMEKKIETIEKKQVKYDVFFALLGAGLIITSSAIITLVVKVFIGQ